LPIGAFRDAILISKGLLYEIIEKVRRWRFGRTGAGGIASGTHKGGFGAFQFAFTNIPGAVFTALTTTNLALPLSNWTALGSVPEVSPGQFQFTDPQATNDTRRFYRARSP
jgi:hypothetical protein